MLKEKGFDETVISFYPPGDIQRPTHQMAIKWLREEYGIFIEISALKRYRWVYTIYKLFEEKIIEVWNDGTYVSYEEAVEAALKYALENLI